MIILFVKSGCPMLSVVGCHLVLALAKLLRAFPALRIFKTAFSGPRQSMRRAGSLLRVLMRSRDFGQKSYAEAANFYHVNSPMDVRNVV